ncbi:MAG TPA: TolC family protein [Candidatus Angelobacter sp.]|nr:TolC family protein [Candidatus Angelobacter sp.]
MFPKILKAALAVLAAGALILTCAPALGQTSDALGYSVSTPRPINPAEGTTNPSAQATQAQNPYLGSVPAKNTGTHMDLSLEEAIARGLRYNLGLIESTQGNATVRADRLRALAALLPQISAGGLAAYEDLSLKEIGLKLPAAPGIAPLPPTTSGFGYQDTRVSMTQTIYSAELHNQYRSRKAAEEASILNVRDSRDVVVFAVGTAYVQAIASAARVETAKAQLASAAELERLTEDRVKSEVSPEIDSIRAEVERQSAEQRLTNAVNRHEKDKLALARIIGLAIDQDFSIKDPLAYRPLPGLAPEETLAQALRNRSDVRSAEAQVRSAQLALQAEKGQRIPSVSTSANYGGAGTTVGNFNQVFSVVGRVSVPLYTGGRISADIAQAQSELSRREAEYEDLKGRVGYDIRVASLDLNASDSSVKVAEHNKALAERALAQSKDRYLNGVTNYLEVVQAQEAVTASGENYIQSLFSFNVATISLARAMGAAEARLPQLLGGK